MVGLAALDLILGSVRAGIMRVALIVEIAGMNPDDRASDEPGFRIPLDPIADLDILGPPILLTDAIRPALPYEFSEPISPL